MLKTTTSDTISATPRATIKISNTSTIRHLTNADVRKAALCLLEAFKEDSLAKLLVCHLPENKRKYAELCLYEAYLRQHIKHGIVLGQGETNEGFETVSIWACPESVHQGLDSFGTLMESGYDKVWQVFGEEGRQKVFYGMLPLLHDSCERIINNDSRFKNKGVYTLVYVGSRDCARGKGNLRKMFEYMFTKYIDADDSLAYLESSSPNNIPIYERFGFKVVEDIVLGEKSDGAVEGEHFAVMNVMIRGVKGHDWTQDENISKGKL
ncbi:uncharacterized protein SPAPADRAFT_143158 [Spathaspora passalidarum NRRL Y-27907]|uniref:N-acetyltransferase domain-containing protein n=1 Tax=Spathaspora passalidarum (strain NRRL Y-27907 / 11-Y1) TaxID=619300 RepID=G3AU75_SPAPN|nr:uncharacterized protein SPAPADRAFT_143158 [Spathaspora passalidarum NRRL Y-27907]EGW30451.1 hypothetical protein SPAPADRAFT_143158 [Spathaspora passalidarum NRRL Y-27907]